MHPLLRLKSANILSTNAISEVSACRQEAAHKAYRRSEALPKNE